MFNGQNSVLWCNVRDAFGVEISQMYRTLRSQGILSYSIVEQRFEDHQAKWPEAVFNEDAWQKYINPLIAPGEGKTATASYLEMAQGSKKEQRKWWLYNRFRYMDSKWTAGDARANIIELRGYAKANITVTPYTDIYASIRYASYSVSERATHGVPVTLTCPIDQLNDSEIHIYSAPQLASVGDLSPLKVGRADFRAATNLQDIRVGSNATGYTNPNLTQLYVGNNSLLRTIDARNCTALAGALDFSGASNVEHVYLDGTAVTSVSLPVGGIMKTLSLPDTITNLTVQSQPGITSFSMEGSDYSSITTLRVENSGSAIPVLDILSQMSAGSRVRILGFVALADTTQDVEDFFDFLDTMAGMTEAGINTDKPVVQGTITGLDTITGAWLAEMNERYPDATIEYEHISSTLKYYSWDGETLLHTETVTDGGNGTWDSTPTRTSTAQYSYTFIGWSLYTDQSTADPTATQGVGADRSVYAVYTATTRTYTVTWKNADNTTLETDTNVPYGTTPTYNGQTPTYQGETSTGWNPAVGPITGDTTYTAIYIPTYQVRFYSGTSSSSSGTLLQNTRVQEGSAAVYSGSTPTNPDGQNYWEFTGWDKVLTNIRTATDFYAQYRDTRSVVIQFVEGTMTDYFSDTATKITALSNRTPLKTVTTTATQVISDSLGSNDNLTTADFTSSGAVSFGGTPFSSCPKLTALIIRSTSMSTITSATALNGTAIADRRGAVYVPANLVSTYETNSYWSNYIIASTDEYPLTDLSDLRDVSWSQIGADIASGMASIKYRVGQTKQVDFGSEGKVDMRIVGFGVDELADNTGMAGITFIGRQTLATEHRMNATQSMSGGWADTEMKSYLNSSIVPLVPNEIASLIRSVKKYSYVDSSNPNDETNDSLWIPSTREVVISSPRESVGPSYDKVYTSSNITNRIAYNQSGTATSWHLRSCYSDSYSYAVGSSGGASSAYPTSNYGVLLGFCIGTYVDPWEPLLESIDNGTLKTMFSVGDTLPLNLGTEGVVEMQIVAFDEDVSHVTLLSKNMLGTLRTINGGGATTGGWKNSDLRSYLAQTVLPLVPSTVRDSIVDVTKYSRSYDGSTIVVDETTTDKLWVPSTREIFGATNLSYEQTGPSYSSLFPDNASRVRRDSSNTARYWWLRSVSNNGAFYAVHNNGSASSAITSAGNGVVIGFCL